MNKRQYFGTDGIRGRFGSHVMRPEFMMKLGWAVGTVLIQKNIATVLIGHDTRQSADVLESALQTGLLFAGINVKLLGTLPTPAVAYLTRSQGASVGIVISASHNPYQDNGVKFFNQEGMKLSDEIEFAIESTLEKTVKMTDVDYLGKIEPIIDAKTQYISFCKSLCPPQFNLKGVKLILDCANGATYHVAPRLFNEIDAEVISIHCSPNGKNINQNCGATNVEKLQIAVNKHKADAGLAFDGDGDRLIMVDHKGEIVDGDEMLCILAKDRHATVAESTKQDVGIVGTVMSNFGLEKALIADGFAFERTAVGDRYVLEKLLEKGWVLGGEASGHIVDLDCTTTGDGIVTGLQILRIMRETGKTLHELKQGMTKRPQVLLNVPIKQKFNIESNVMISEAVTKAEENLKGNGRVLLRPSGTEPLIRVMVEGNNKDTVQRAAESIALVVKEIAHKEQYD